MFHIVLCLCIKEDRFLFLLLLFLRSENGGCINIVQVATEVGATLILVGHRDILFAIIVLQYSVVLTCRLDLLLLLDREIVFVVQLGWQETEFIRGV